METIHDLNLKPSLNRSNSEPRSTFLQNNFISLEAEISNLKELYENSRVAFDKLLLTEVTEFQTPFLQLHGPQVHPGAVDALIGDCISVEVSAVAFALERIALKERLRAVNAEVHSLSL
jgi:hypothetical protein